MDEIVQEIRRITERDPRYCAEAYAFVQEGLGYAVRRLEKPIAGPQRHVSGRELLEGLREFALQEFGAMAKRVLNEFGVYECLDFGYIVFNMVDAGLLGKTEQDSIDDFAEGYCFDEAFRLPFLPESDQLSMLG